MKQILRICADLAILAALLASCYSRRELAYYADKENYIQASGVVTDMMYNEDKTALYLAFSDLDYNFDDNNFKIIGEGLQIAKSNGIDEKVELGKTVSFIAAPMYLGDGYVIPIAFISVGEETLLYFDDGFKSIQGWLNKTN